MDSDRDPAQTDEADARAQVGVEQIQADLEATREQLLRTTADFQNYRRRAEQEKDTLVTLGRRQVLEQMLDIYDDVTRALEAIWESETPHDPTGVCRSLKAGFELVHRKFSEALTRFDVQPMDVVGKPFDEHEHEAVMQRPDADVPPGTVVAEVQKGYRMGDQVLRHAKVMVATE